jgi:hypothetical protein
MKYRNTNLCHNLSLIRDTAVDICTLQIMFRPRNILAYLTKNTSRSEDEFLSISCGELKVIGQDPKFIQSFRKYDKHLKRR